MFVFRSFLAAALAVIAGGVATAPAAHAEGTIDATPRQVARLASVPAEAAPRAVGRPASVAAEAMPRVVGRTVSVPSGAMPRAAAQATGVSVGAVPRPAGRDAGIPDEAMLRPADLGGAETREADAESWPALRPPRPCGMRAPKPAADRAVSAIVDADRAPVVVLEYVAQHPAGAAERYLRRLRAAVRDCPNWRLEKSGTDTLTMRWTQTWEHVDDRVTHHTYVAVARTGRAIVLVADLGWETSSGERARAERLITPATRRAAVLH
ncbi:hypothetical protein QLQ12_02020 [Actinoplanes sp. NEAU-A12]|uniref:PknH-like extracellular domain-containing protein n=1 Tax=Actinoplanes sandaracinus TaxID=3045177 RepID=A0ABT6WCC9_9ACTN|nr:hypothetical protein [Actinoplanes sandaracinus]MDI6097378.1 hypothetical protein [Actinoplanes sandaracinus]